MTVKKFEDLEIWKLARQLTRDIYRATAVGKFAGDYGLRDQIGRAAVSVMSNIAEGYERSGNQELIQFLAIAKGSSGEVRCQLYIAKDLAYLESDQAEKLIDSYMKLSIMIYKFMEYLKSSKFKGTKYKKPRQKSQKEVLDEFFKEQGIELK